MILIGLALVGGVVTAAVTVYCTPKNLRVGYEPIQPVPFSHAVHAGQLGMDCRYCHGGVEKSWVANIPAASTCMNCHSQVLKDDPRLALVRESAATGKPIPWVQVHITPDYVYFNHSVHVMRGISCVECHGRIDQMDEVRHAKPLSMSFCLDCHRDPAAHIRPTDKVTDLGWTWSTNGVEAAHLQTVEGKKLVEHMRVESLQSCSACHR
jgi:Cytochrome c7 and related cytochrome c